MYWVELGVSERYNLYGVSLRLRQEHTVQLQRNMHILLGNPHAVCQSVSGLPFKRPHGVWCARNVALAQTKYQLLKQCLHRKQGHLHIDQSRGQFRAAIVVDRDCILDKHLFLERRIWGASKIQRANGCGAELEACWNPAHSAKFCQHMEKLHKSGQDWSKALANSRPSILHMARVSALLPKVSLNGAQHLWSETVLLGMWLFESCFGIVQMMGFA